MNYNQNELRGRNLLLLLLALNVVLHLVSNFSGLRNVWGLLAPETAAGVVVRLLAGALPLVALSWAIFRGSWPGIAVICIVVVTGVGDMVGLFQFGGAAAMNPDTLLALARLLTRGGLLAAVFRHYDVNCWWSLCQARRGTKDLVVEVLVFVAAIAVSFLVGAFWGA